MFVVLGYKVTHIRLGLGQSPSRPCPPPVNACTYALRRNMCTRRSSSLRSSPLTAVVLLTQVSEEATMPVSRLLLGNTGDTPQVNWPGSHSTKLLLCLSGTLAHASSRRALPA